MLNKCVILSFVESNLIGNHTTFPHFHINIFFKLLNHKNYFEKLYTYFGSLYGYWIVETSSFLHPYSTSSAVEAAITCCRVDLTHRSVFSLNSSTILEKYYNNTIRINIPFYRQKKELTLPSIDNPLMVICDLHNFFMHILLVYICILMCYSFIILHYSEIDWSTRLWSYEWFVNCNYKYF